MASTWAKAGLGVNVYLLGQAAIAKECGRERGEEDARARGMQSEGKEFRWKNEQEKSSKEKGRKRRQ